MVHVEILHTCLNEVYNEVYGSSWETFPKSMARFSYCLILGSLFWKSHNLEGFTLHKSEENNQMNRYLKKKVKEDKKQMNICKLTSRNKHLKGLKDHMSLHAKDRYPKSETNPWCD